MSHWYALKSRDELFTFEMLSAAGFTAYVPCEIVERNICRRKVRQQKPALRGYIFVHCDEGAFRAIRAIGLSDDFVRCLDPAGDMVPMRLAPNALVEIVLAELFGDLDHTRVPKPWEPERGDAVKVTAGMWNGYLGAIISVGVKQGATCALVQLKNWKKEFSVGELEQVA